MNPEQIAQAVGAPPENVAQTWPYCIAALTWQGINDRPTRIALAATIAVETAVTENGRNMTFLPVTELGGPSAWYAPWFGRGTIQCTFEGNYAWAGPRMDPPMNLLANPDALLGQRESAQFAALYFVSRGIPAMARAGNHRGVRVAVNGGNGIDRFDGGTTNGMNVFLGHVSRLSALPDAPPAPAVTTAAVRGILRTAPADTAPHAINPQHQPVVLEVGAVVHFAPDPHTHQATTPHWAHVVVGDGPVHGWYRRDQLTTTGG